MRNSHLFLLIACFIYSSCSQKSTDSARSSRSRTVQKAITENIDQTEILWDEWGVPHIYATDNEALFYSFGYAQMHSHANTILKLYAKSRGQAAEYWGEQYLENDMMVHALNFPKTAKRWYNMQSPEFKGYIDAFVKGMNEYVIQNPKTISDQNKVVLPISNQDVLQHALFVLYSRFVGGGDLQAASRWDQKGSNTYAIGPEKSASGNAMLVMNPHLPWYDEWLFYEGHFNTPELNIYGATLVGLPTLGIAFNEQLGWSHTNNTIDNADRYEITIKDGQYEVDGEWRDLIARTATLKVKLSADSTRVIEQPFYESRDHGHVLKVNGDKALTIKMPGYDRPYGIVQWWNMGTSENLASFKASLRRVQIPFFNIMYADQEGNIFYMFNGQVPERATGDWSYWSGVVDGSSSENLWDDVHSYDELPKVENPASGWLQNANDPPWTSTFPMELHPDSFPAYMSPVRMGFRPQRAVRMLMEDDSISFDELVEYKLSTRIEMADRLLDDLYAAIDEYGDEDAQEAKAVLMVWDRQADAESQGMALFYAWAHTISPWRSSNYEDKWQLSKAMETPDGLADPEAAVQALSGVVQDFKSKNIPLDIPWGKVYRIKYNDKDLPGNGSDGSVGIFRVAWSEGQSEDGIQYISGGDSWQGIIEFGDRVKAKVLMSYGNSTQPGSKHYGDQLELFSQKQMRDCYFYRSDVLKHVKKKEKLNP